MVAIPQLRCLVTGGASGLGAGAVRTLASKGAKVLLVDLKTSRGEQAASEIGPNCRFFPADVTSESDIQAAIEFSNEHLGPINGVVNCAGILLAKKVLNKKMEAHDMDSFERVLKVNVLGSFNVLRLAVKSMAENTPNEVGERGVIINTSSIAAFEGQTGQAAYSASKGAIASMTLPIARELGPLGIRVVSVAPGVFETAMVTGMADKVREYLNKNVPFPPRFGHPDEFGALVQSIFENSMLNGSVIRLDGAFRLPL